MFICFDLLVSSLIVMVIAFAYLSTLVGCLCFAGLLCYCLWCFLRLVICCDSCGLLWLCLVGVYC